MKDKLVEIIHWFSILKRTLAKTKWRCIRKIEKECFEDRN